MPMDLDRGTLRAAGFTEQGMLHVEEQLQRAVECHDIPGGVLAVGRGDTTVARAAAGYEIDLADCQRPMTYQTVFDLASLTKVCATLPALLALLESGDVLLSDRLGAWLPEYRDGMKQKVTVKHLLTHTAGLPPGDSLPSLPDVATRWERVMQIPLAAPPGEKVVYSDIGFLLVGRLIEAIAQVPLDQFVRTNILTPLAMLDTVYRPTVGTARPERSAWSVPAYDPPGYAATEVLASTGLAAYGFVHDENAYSLGGVCGHAGLFGTVGDLSQYAAFWLGHAQGVLSRRTLETAIQCATPGLDGRRGLGWCLRGDAYDHMGDLWPQTAFGHTGFTGTSITMDPDTGVWVVLLTNRVHYGRQGDPLRTRRIIHNAVMTALQ